MIVLLKGCLLEKDLDQVVVLVAGVGYEVEMPGTHIAQLPEVGDAVSIHVHHYIREDQQKLFGFCQRRDREVFRLLIKAAGVGAKVALAVLAALPADTVVEAIVMQDAGMLTQAKGVGKRLAEKMVVELKSAAQQFYGDSAVISSAPTRPTATADALSGQKRDAQLALLALGYQPSPVARALQAVSQPEMTTEQLIKAALQELNQGRLS